MPRGVVVVQPLHVAGERAAGVAGVAAAVAERRRAARPKIRRSSTRSLTSTWAGAYEGALAGITACRQVCEIDLVRVRQGPRGGQEGKNGRRNG